MKIIIIKYLLIIWFCVIYINLLNFKYFDFNILYKNISISLMARWINKFY